MKRTGIISNYFFAYRENGKYYLMDGFNRLFTDYGNIDINCTVYLKVLIDKLEDNQLMSAMFNLNMWKLKTNLWGFEINDFFDRGFRLFIFSKFGIFFYHYNDDFDVLTGKRYYVRERYKDDIDVLDYYFRNEWEMSDSSKHTFETLAKLFSQKNIVVDIREIVESNNYKEKPFNNYDMFLNGFIMYLSLRRALGDGGEYKFQTYLNKLYEDKKFFKKLQDMCGNDSTRKNIYNFYREKKENTSNLPISKPIRL
jgi:hypothetical protein